MNEEIHWTNSLVKLETLENIGLNFLNHWYHNWMPSGHTLLLVSCLHLSHRLICQFFGVKF